MNENYDKQLLLEFIEAIRRYKDEEMNNNFASLYICATTSFGRVFVEDMQAIIYTIMTEPDQLTDARMPTYPKRSKIIKVLNKLFNRDHRIWQYVRVD